MLASPLRYYKHMKIVNHRFLALGNGNFGAGSKAYHSKDIGSCCKDVPQTEGKKLESWPKPDSPPPAWRGECPRDPQPPNYDPYRIKVPDVVVPPLPPSNAKWSGQMLTVTDGGRGGLERPAHGDAEPEQLQQQAQAADQAQAPDDPKEEGFMGLLRGLFDRLKGKSKGGDTAMMTELDPCTLRYPIIEDTKKEIPNEDSRELFKSPEIQFDEPHVKDLFYNSPIVHPDYWKHRSEKKQNNVEDPKETLPKLGYHGRSKYKYAFHEPWKPLDRMTLLEEAAKQELDTVEELAAAVKTDK